MLTAASPWQLAHDFSPSRLLFHSVSPRATQCMPGLAKSSCCSERTSAPTKALPGLSGEGRSSSAANVSTAAMHAAAPSSRAAHLCRGLNARNSPRTSRTDGDRSALTALDAAVVLPHELQFSAIARHREKLQIGVCRNTGAQLGAEHFLAAVT